MDDAPSAIVFRDVPGFPGYRVGSDGSVWSCRNPNGSGLTGKWRKKKCKATGSSSGYVRVSLMRDNKLHLVGVHRLVLLAFVGPAPEGMEACHFPDRNPANNNLANLRWGTQKENQHDRVKHETDSSGERNGRAKLDRNKVARMRADFARGGISKAELGRRYGVSNVMAGLIVRGRNWK